MNDVKVKTTSSAQIAALRARQAQSGVTLVEVLIVVAIMALLAGGVAFSILPKFGETQAKEAKRGALELRKMAQLWQADNGSDCPTISTLKKAKLMDRASSPKDPWGKRYVIRCADGEIFVASNGPDKKKGSSDDIEVPGGEDDEEE